MPILTDQERCGTMLASRYHLDSILGRGGMGVVFRARDGDEPVAVKILRPELAHDPALAKRFLREARAGAAIRHPNVVDVLDLGVEPDGTIYQVLQLLEGQSLRDHLAAKGRLGVERTLKLLLPILGALEAAHERGIVHRDLKPDNIFLARRTDGEVLPTLLDFGIAKLLDGQGSFATNTGSIMGTPAYMAPEQATGSKEQGPSIDVWAMGIIVYECLAGAPPFVASSPAGILLKVMTETPPALDRIDPAIPAAIARAVERALERRIADRLPSVRALADALRAAADEAGLATPEPGRTSTVTPLSLSPPGPTEISIDLEASDVDPSAALSTRPAKSVRADAPTDDARIAAAAEEAETMLARQVPARAASGSHHAAPEAGAVAARAAAAPATTPRVRGASRRTAAVAAIVVLICVVVGAWAAAGGAPAVDRAADASAPAAGPAGRRAAAADPTAAEGSARGAAQLRAPQDVVVAADRSSQDGAGQAPGAGDGDRREDRSAPADTRPEAGPDGPDDGARATIAASERAAGAGAHAPHPRGRGASAAADRRRETESGAPDRATDRGGARRAGSDEGASRRGLPGVVEW